MSQETLNAFIAKVQTDNGLLEQMKVDEIRHAETASHHGARELPQPVKLAMKFSSKVMTRLSYLA